MPYEVALGWSRKVRASCASCFSPATAAGGAATFFPADNVVFLFFAAGDAFTEGFCACFAVVCACFAGVCPCIGNATAITSNNNGMETARLWKRAASLAAVFTLLAQDGGGIGIRPKSIWIAAG